MWDMRDGEMASVDFDVKEREGEGIHEWKDW